MPNTKLYGEKFVIPKDIIEYVKKQLVINPKGDGIKRAKNIAYGDGYITYQSLERFKNFFDREVNMADPESKKRYELAGGDKMKNFVEKTLQQSRDSVERGEKIKREAGLDTKKGGDNLKVQQSIRTDKLKV